MAANTALRLLFWTQDQLKTFGTPPTDIEREATKVFVKAGLESNRAAAALAAIGPLIASGSMFFIGLPRGMLHCVVLLSQGHVTEGASEAVSGVFNSTRSLYNILAVFTTAIVGLLPIPYLNGIMYKAMIIPRTEKELGEERYKDVKALETFMTEVEKSLKNTGTFISDTEPSLISGSTKLATILRNLLLKADGFHDPVNSQEYKTLEESLKKAQLEYQKKIEELNNTYTETLQKTLELEKNESDSKIKTVNLEHEQEKNKLAKEHVENLNKLRESLSKLMSEELEEKEKKILETKEHLEKVHKTYIEELKNAKDPEKNGSAQSIQDLNKKQELKLLEVQNLHNMVLKDLGDKLEKLTQEVANVRNERDTAHQKYEQLETQLKTLTQTTSEEKEKLSKELGQKQNEIEQLKKRHLDELNDLTQNHTTNLSQVKNELGQQYEKQNNELVEKSKQSIALLTQLLTVMKAQPKNLTVELKNTLLPDAQKLFDISGLNSQWNKIASCDFTKMDDINVSTDFGDSPFVFLQTLKNVINVCNNLKKQFEELTLKSENTKQQLTSVREEKENKSKQLVEEIKGTSRLKQENLKLQQEIETLKTQGSKQQ